MLRPLAFACALVGLGLAAPSVEAAKVHFKKTPVIVDNGLTLTASGALTGLGNGDVTITIIAEGSASVVLLNPSDQFVPGQNRLPITVSGSQTISATEIKNGNVRFSVTTATPENPTPEEAGAPNDNWSAFIDDVIFSSATIIVQQGGKTVLKTTIVAD